MWSYKHGEGKENVKKKIFFLLTVKTSGLCERKWKGKL